jgi:hypothetical protein
MTNLRLVTPWVAAAALLIGIGSDPGAEDRVSVSDDPVTRIASALLVSPQDKMGDAPEAPGLPQSDAGPVGLGALAAVVGLAVRRGSVNRLEASSSRGPPGRSAIHPSLFTRPVPSRSHNIPLDPSYRWSTGRGLSTCSARVTTRTQENAP